jgi:hypothetical protein
MPHSLHTIFAYLIFCIPHFLHSFRVVGLELGYIPLHASIFAYLIFLHISIFAYNLNFKFFAYLFCIPFLHTFFAYLIFCILLGLWVGVHIPLHTFRVVGCCYTLAYLFLHS